MNLRYFPKGIISTTSLPIWHAFSSRQSNKFLVESITLQERIATSNKIGQQYDMQIITRSEAFLATYIEQGRNLAESILVNINGVAGESDKVLVSDSLVSSQSSTITLVIQIQQVNSLNTRLFGIIIINNTSVISQYGFTNHVINGTHNQGINLNSHGLFNTVVQHGQESVKLVSVAERFLDLLFSKGHSNLESGLAIKELSRNSRLIKNILLVLMLVGKLPTLILRGYWQVAGNFFQYRTELPTVH